MSKHLAIDIGASSGRAILGDLSDKLTMTEINRFTIEINNKNGERLNISKLLFDVRESIKIATASNNDIVSIGIDTWAVDSVCLDKYGKRVADPMFYRDNSFVEALAEYEQKNDLGGLYAKTGIQIQPFNTIFQMEKLESNYNIAEIDKILMLPDYIAYELSGASSFEFTNATTTQSIDLATNQLFCKHADKFVAISNERIIGTLNPELSNGHDIKIVSVATHDTASAILAIPNLRADDCFISSGTWSLLGKHVSQPIVNQKAFEYNFSNEGNYDHSYRFQKNIMGLWIIVSYAREQKFEDYPKLNELAFASTVDTIIDVNDPLFLNPESMTFAIEKYCLDHQLQLPETIGDFARVIYRSLARSYKLYIEELIEASSTQINTLTIVGGGAKAEFLNEEINKLISQQLRLFPYECSALGNIIVQGIETGRFPDLETAHSYIAANLKLEIKEK